MSDARRAAKAVVDRRVERFESRRGMDESRARLEAALSRARLESRVVFTPAWHEREGKAILEATFSPPPRVESILRILSISFTLLIATTAWAVLTGGAGVAASWLLGLSTILAVLTMPWIFIAMGSNRLAEEARILRAIRAALMDEAENLPPRQRWDDEE